jgi:hypothetical protein
MEAPSHRYFADEAGDLAVFNRRGRTIVCDAGVSTCFIVGATLVPDPVALSSRLSALRTEFIADPYFARVPSMQPHALKTARLFHAKDDVPEVRHRVFQLLRDSDLQVFCAFRRKAVVAAQLRARFATTGQRTSADVIYADLVRAIFTNRLHIAEKTHVVFARRGQTDHNVALLQAVQSAKAAFERKWRKGIDRPTTVASSTPTEEVCLQASDYYLWALQRLLERGEDRYFRYLSPAFRLIIDRDDSRRHGHGEFYTASSNPLTLERLMPVSLG